jgi:hypothetical protein
LLQLEEKYTGGERHNLTVYENEDANLKVMVQNFCANRNQKIAQRNSKA